MASFSNDRIKVLIADDDADDRMFFENAYCDRHDIDLLPCVENGTEVLDRLDNTASDLDLPGLIILDHNMPLMNGKQTLSFLKSSERYSKIPVCICSTYADILLTEDCLKLGAYKVLSKPITELEYQLMMDEFMTVFQEK